MKTCKKCTISKPISDFYTGHSTCKECRKVQQHLYRTTHPYKVYQNSPERKAQQFKTFIKRKYDLTLEQYNDLLVEHDYKCKICGKSQSEIKKKLCIDHCHETGRVRGLLCFDCNTGLGKFLDSPTIIQKAMDYLKA